ncbi:MAG TPA: Zn-dependent alcohol dehydrogenase [Bacteroidota bacterium]
MNTRAAVLYKTNTPFVIETLELAPPRKGEVLLKVAATGVCHSDWHLATGATAHPLPVVVGHEGAGVVESIGDGVTRVKPGDHVALNWAPSCGTCFYCTNGKPSLCSTYVEPVWAGTMMDGTTRFSKNGKQYYHFNVLACFAERVVVPQECCVPLPKEVPLTIAALIGCAVTTGVGAVLNTAQVKPDSAVAVFGAGGVGLSVIMGAKLAGARTIIAVDRHEAKRAIASSLGATHVLINPADPVKEIKSLTDGRGADYVFEAIGIPALQELSLQAARPGGTIILAGISPMGSNTNLPGAIITRQEKTIMGSYYGTADPAHDFPRYAEYYLQGKLPLDKMISKSYPLDNINEAYAEMLTGAIARSVVVF